MCLKIFANSLALERNLHDLVPASRAPTASVLSLIKATTAFFPFFVIVY